MNGHTLTQMSVCIRIVLLFFTVFARFTAFADPIEDLLKVKFGSTRAEAKAAMESGGADFSQKQKWKFTTVGAGYKFGEFPTWDAWYSVNPANEQKFYAVGITFRPEGDLLQQYRGITQWIEGKLGVPAFRNDEKIESGGVAAKTQEFESIWVFPQGGDLKKATFLRCYFAPREPTKTMTVQVEVYAAEYTDPNRIAGLVGRMALKSNEAAISTPKTTDNSAGDPATRDVLLKRVANTKWRWTVPSSSFASTVTFTNRTLEFAWGGNAEWSVQSDGSLALRDTAGKVSILTFDQFYTTFQVKSGGKVSAMGTRLDPSKEIASQTAGEKAAGSSTPSSAAQQTAKTIQLRPGWDTPMKGGTNTMDDLNRLFTPVVKASINLAGDPSIQVYEGVPYLGAFQEALKPLGITSRAPSKVLIATPGFPRDSFFYYAIDGRFEGEFNRLYVVVDTADQVVSIQLVDETPRDSSVPFSSQYDWSTYNFVNSRSKAMSKLRIGHQVLGKSRSGWKVESGFSDVKLFRVDSYLLNPSDRIGQPSEMKEKVRWYVPKPLAELILYCVQKNVK